MALKQIKNKIISTQKTGKVTKAMEAVSAVKMRKSQEKAQASRPYVKSALTILTNISRITDFTKNHFIAKRELGKKLLVIVTSDKGLAGSVNSAVLKQAEEFFIENSDTDIIAVGKKAYEFALREKKTILANYTNISDGITMDDVYSMSEKITAQFSNNKYKTVEIIYQNFISTFEQEPTRRKVLPLDTSELFYMMQGIGRINGAIPREASELIKPQGTYTVEPSRDEVLEVLIPQLVQIIIYHALLESKASEHSARMVAMKNATDKARDLTKSLNIIYNKERQASITAEVSEITGGIEAMNEI